MADQSVYDKIQQYLNTVPPDQRDQIMVWQLVAILDLNTRLSALEKK